MNVDHQIWECPAKFRIKQYLETLFIFYHFLRSFGVVETTEAWKIFSDTRVESGVIMISDRSQDLPLDSVPCGPHPHMSLSHRCIFEIYLLNLPNIRKSSQYNTLRHNTIYCSTT